MVEEHIDWIQFKHRWGKNAKTMRDAILLYVLAFVVFFCLPSGGGCRSLHHWGLSLSLSKLFTVVYLRRASLLVLPLLVEANCMFVFGFWRVDKSRGSMHEMLFGWVMNLYAALTKHYHHIIGDRIQHIWSSEANHSPGNYKF